MKGFVISISNTSQSGYQDIYTHPGVGTNYYPWKTDFSREYRGQYVEIYRNDMIITICEVQVFVGKVNSPRSSIPVPLAVI